MTKAGKRLIEAAKEAVSIAKGEQPAARIHMNGHSYVPAEHAATLETAILTIIKAMNEYLPPTGGDKDKFISEVIGAVDNRDLVRAMRKADAP